MAQRYFMFSYIAVLAICFMSTFSSEAAPAFKFKKSFSTYDQVDKFSPSRSDRRLMGGTSPIHFIQPFMSLQQPMGGFNNFFAPQVSPSGNPASSSIYKLPLRLFSNGKPYAVFQGLPKPRQVMEFLPQAVSNIIRLPLKYMSNAKPIGVYFKDPSFNYL